MKKKNHSYISQNSAIIFYWQKQSVKDSKMWQNKVNLCRHLLLKIACFFSYIKNDKMKMSVLLEIFFFFLNRRNEGCNRTKSEWIFCTNLEKWHQDPWNAKANTRWQCNKYAEARFSCGIHSSKHTDILSQEKAQGTDETELLSHISLKSETCCLISISSAPHCIHWKIPVTLWQRFTVYSSNSSGLWWGPNTLQYSTRYVYDKTVSYNSTLFSQHKITVSKLHHILCQLQIHSLTSKLEFSRTQICHSR